MTDPLRQIIIDPKLSKEDLFKSILAQVSELGFNVKEIDSNRPWGGFIRIADNQSGQFIKTYFKGVQLPKQAIGLDISPKLLIVEPGKRLSYQVHKRRSELWRVLNGPIGVKLNSTDDEPENIQKYDAEEVISVPLGTRHRLIGLNTIGVVAELWIHNDPNNPSNEEDNRRIQDDFSRIKDQ